jgi:hypothetical protein
LTAAAQAADNKISDGKEEALFLYAGRTGHLASADGSERADTAVTDLHRKHMGDETNDEE